VCEDTDKRALIEGRGKTQRTRVCVCVCVCGVCDACSGVEWLGCEDDRLCVRTQTSVL